MRRYPVRYAQDISKCAGRVRGRLSDGMERRLTVFASWNAGTAERRTGNCPLLSCRISGWTRIFSAKGIVTSKSTKGIYKAMKEFLDNGYRIEKKFNARKHNLEVEKQIKKILKNS